jgi:TonB family protein
MTRTPPRGTLLNIPLVEERYGRSFALAVGLHVLVLAFFLLAPLFLPSLSPLQLGTGAGGGTGGESYTIGVADDLGGGAGMYKPALTPQPPVRPKETKKAEAVSKAVPLPGVVEPKTKKKAPETSASKSKKAEPAETNAIPVANAKGAGGAGGQAGSGGGAGGGTGVSIGSGTGGTMDSWYARAVEARVGSNWIRPVVQDRIEIVYSFLVDNNGRIYNIKKEKSCGNESLDLSAYRAIQASNPLTPPPPELRDRNLQFVCQFVYPPN